MTTPTDPTNEASARAEADQAQRDAERVAREAERNAGDAEQAAGTSAAEHEPPANPSRPAA